MPPTPLVEKAPPENKVLTRPPPSPPVNSPPYSMAPPMSNALIVIADTRPPVKVALAPPLGAALTLKPLMVPRFIRTYLVTRDRGGVEDQLQQIILKRVAFAHDASSMFRAPVAPGRCQSACAAAGSARAMALESWVFSAMVIPQKPG